MDVIALKAEEFTLKEKNSSIFCIWCKKDNKKNRAHILSKKLIRRNSPQNVLINSVCIECNSKWGKIEEWLMKFSPLNLFRFLYHSEKSKGIQYVPQYIYLTDFSQWFAIYRDNKRSMHLHKQIIFKDGIPNYIMVGLTDGKSNQHLSNQLYIEMFSKKCKISVNKELPNDFEDRIIISNDKNIIVAKTQSTANKILIWFNESKITKPDLNLEKTKVYETKNPKYKDLTIQFLWEDSIWKMYSLKVWFEFLAQHQGSQFCLNNCFNVIRNTFTEFEISNQTQFRKIILKDNTKFLNDMLDYSLEISFVKNQIKPLSSISIPVSGDVSVTYEIEDGILTSDLQIGFCPKARIQIDLLNKRLENDFFYTCYDYEKDNFLNMRLSEKWENNRMLIIAQPIDNFKALTQYPNKYLIKIPVVQK